MAMSLHVSLRRCVCNSLGCHDYTQRHSENRDRGSVTRDRLARDGGRQSSELARLRRNGLDGGRQSPGTARLRRDGGRQSPGTARLRRDGGRQSPGTARLRRDGHLGRLG